MPTNKVQIIDESTPIIVTPDSPLNINETPVTLDTVEIRGGLIYTHLDTNVTIRQLTKTE